VLRANATVRDGYGGEIELAADGIGSGGNLTIAGNGIKVNGGDRIGAAGVVEASARRTIRLAAAIDGKGGEFSAEVLMEAGEDILTEVEGRFDLAALSPYSINGVVSLEAGGSLTLRGPIIGTSSRAGGEGSDAYGGVVYLGAGGDVWIDAMIDVSCEAPDSYAGGLEVEAGGDIFLRAPVTGRANGESGISGGTNLTASRVGRRRSSGFHDWWLRGR
jgi:hypothetical protein